MQGIFDSHSHYDDSVFFTPDSRFKTAENAVRSLEDVFGRGVSHILSCGTDIKSSRLNMELADKYSNLYFAAGIHPECVEDCPDGYLKQLKPLLSHRKCVAVGEIGLDYSYEIPHGKQKRIFREQLLLAKELNLPVSVHDREAHQDCFDILSELKPRGVLHCYSGSVELAREYVKLGFYLGITGIVTFKNAKKAKELAQWIPLDRLLIETDAPYLAPVPFRGYRNDSSLLTAVAEEIALIRGTTAREVIDTTRRNACTLFNIKED